MKKETIVRLIIRSEEISPEVISQALGLDSDKSWKIGEIRKSTKIPRKENGWILNCKLPKEAPLEDQVLSLLTDLRPKAAEIFKMSGKASVVFSCVVYAESEPPLFFEKEVVAQIGALGASLDIDQYILKEKAGLK